MVSEAVTHAFRVRVKAFFLPEHSDVEKKNFFWAYHIRITNEGETPATLLSRHWIITNGIGYVEEVKGPGVVGKQPRILPGETFEYTSMCPLRTQYGTMEGTYHMRADDGATFNVDINPFTLFVPALAN